jgi:glutathione synthase/RimK-type ligase-like ATP-grasp enzyme
VIIDSGKVLDIKIDAEHESVCGVDLSNITAFYVIDLGLRSPVVRKENGEPDVEASAQALPASRRHFAAWNSLLARLAMRCPVVNPPETHDVHSLKPWEVAAYVQRGLPVPVTLSTSDAQALTVLPENPSGEWIRKGMVGGYDYTEAFTPPQTLDDSQRVLDGGPLMVQERINGDNLRAFVLDGEVIGAAEVVTQAGEETDSRRGEIRVRRTELPEVAARDAVAAVRHWGMTFAAVDFMVDARSGRYMILECNSAPFFVNFERMTGLPITGRLADFLVGRGSSA